MDSGLLPESAGLQIPVWAHGEIPQGIHGVIIFFLRGFFLVALVRTGSPLFSGIPLYFPYDVTAARLHFELGSLCGVHP